MGVPEMVISTMGDMKVISPVFSGETIITVIMKFTFIMGTSCTELRLLFHKSSFIVNTLFQPLCETLYAGCTKLSEVPELFVCAVSAHSCH